MDTYDTAYVPPAPVVDVKVSNPVFKISESLKGLIDTGAFRSAIPSTLIDKLQINPHRKRPVRGFKGAEIEQWTYFVNILFKGFNFEFIEVFPSETLKEVLIGRDIINDLTILLQGKKHNFEITDP